MNVGFKMTHQIQTNKSAGLCLCVRACVRACVHAWMSAQILQAIQLCESS